MQTNLIIVKILLNCNLENSQDKNMYNFITMINIILINK